MIKKLVNTEVLGFSVTPRNDLDVRVEFGTEHFLSLGDIERTVRLPVTLGELELIRDTLSHAIKHLREKE